MKPILGLFLLILYISLGPFLLIWSLNNLFALNILYTFNNWLSAYILIAILSMSLGSNQSPLNTKYNSEKANEKTNQPNT